MKYGSVCSGIEAATMAWHPLDWSPVFFAEIADFPSKVLAHHHPKVPNVGDFTRLIHGKKAVPAIDLLVGGTPCQSFSCAGLRGGLGDDRGNLALEFFRLVDRARPTWVVWENVFGVLSTHGGRDFGSILGALAELGYGFAYRILDAQFFGVPQRRRRVFVVGHSGGWQGAAAVLFERAGLRWDPPPRRAQGQDVAGSLGGGSSQRGWNDDLDRAGAFIPEVAHSLRAEGFDASEDGTGRGTPLVAVGAHGDIAPPLTAKAAKGTGGPSGDECQNLVFDVAQITHPENRVNPSPGDPSPPLAATGRVHLAQTKALAFHALQDPISGDVSPVLDRKQAGMGLLTPRGLVRRLTPRECERLQGFPDDYTLIPIGKKMAADGPRYAGLGNSMAVPVMRWLGERIAMVDKILGGTK